MTTNRALVFIVAVLVTVGLLAAYAFYYLGYDVRSLMLDDVSEEVVSIRTTTNDAEYVTAQDALNNRNYTVAHDAFVRVAQNTPDTTAKMFVLYRAADALRQGQRSVAAVRAFKDLLVNPEYAGVGASTKAAAANRIITVHINDPREEVFEEIFYNEPAVFTSLVAPEDAFPSQIDATYLNVYRFISEEYGASSEAELEVANALFNHNLELYNLLFDACKDDVNIEEDGCSPNINELLTQEQRVLYDQIAKEFNARLKASGEGIQFLEDLGSNGTLARVFNKRARVMHKAMYFGFTKPQDVEEAILASIDYAYLSGNRTAVTNTVLEYGVFLALLSASPSEELKEKIVFLTSKIYLPDGELSDVKNDHIRTINTVYERVTQGEGNAQHLMALRGNVALAMADPGYKDFLINDAGWDFEREPIKGMVGGGS